MNTALKKYFGLLFITIFLFMNFIACGAQMYQVSVEEDLDHRKIPAKAKDPKAPEYGIHAIGGWQELPISFRIGTKLSKIQKEGLVSAMKTWEDAVGIKLFNFVGTDKRNGDSFKDLYSSLSDRVNGHYMDEDWEKTGKPEVVLATTIWDNSNLDTIATADIRFNSYNYSIRNSLDESVNLTSVDSREVVDMQSLALHELGHLLGLAHVDQENDPYSIMNPSLYIGEGLASRKISRGDIERIQRIYSCEGNSCDIDSLILKFEQNKFEDDAEEIATNNYSNEETTSSNNSYSNDEESDSSIISETAH